MTDPKRTWSRPSGTIMADCPKCVDDGKLFVDPVTGVRYGDAACPLCNGKGEVGLATCTAYLLQHAKTDPTGLAEPEDDTKPER